MGTLKAIHLMVKAILKYGNEYDIRDTGIALDKYHRGLVTASDLAGILGEIAYDATVDESRL